MYEKLIKYRQSKIYPFCMPGHKQNFQVPKLTNPYDIDITEVDGFDNLHDPSGILKELQLRLAEVYNVPKVFLSVNGSTAGILAAISAIPSGKAVCVARNCHKSVFDGVSVSGRKTFYLYPDEILPDSMIFGGIGPEAVERMLKRHSEIGAVVVTSPTYEGFLSDIKSLAETAHKYGALLIVDEAHGAHFPYHKAFPVSAIYLGADIVVQSLHKTLPSLNQTALVFVNEDMELQRRVQRALSTFTTTSPSYGLLASIEYCVEWCVENESEFDEYVAKLLSLRKRLSQLSTVALLGEKMVGKHDIFEVDPSKLTLISRQMPGPDLQRYLLKEHQLQMEAAGPVHVLGMTSVMDTEDGFKRLFNALSDAEKIREYPGDPVYSEKQIEEISLLYIGKTGTVYQDFVYLYPPGSPIIAPGEVFTQEIREKILHYIDLGLEVIEWERFSF